VYTSDIKKLASWYNLLHNLNLLVKEEPESAEKEEKAPKGKAPKGKAPKAKKAASTEPKKKAAPKTKKGVKE
ncbi:MAG TPA: hypothetical protein VFE71_09065, partial [Bacteroidales bacterium]|nr:hypothetical protein [Bacteroidales bacterium]